MTYTSAQANKLLKKLNDEHAALLDKENRSKDFRAAMGEDVESVRPAYDYTDTQKKLAELEQRIRKVKHAINMFNATHVIPDFNMTIDEMLVYIPQLTQRKNKLADMKARLPKQRVEEQYGRQSNIIDYSCQLRFDGSRGRLRKGQRRVVPRPAGTGRREPAGHI